MRFFIIKFIVLVWFSVQIFAVDATIRIEKDVEQRTRISIVDGSAQGKRNIFKILFSDLKISGHFLVDSRHNKGSSSSNYILPKFKSKEYVLKYNVTQYKSTQLLVRLLKAEDGTEVFKNTYSTTDRKKLPFLVHKAISDVNNVLHYPDISWINRYVVYAVYTTPRRSEIRLADYTFTYTKTIIRGGLNLFPKWADDAQKNIYYTSYSDVYPTLYKLNIYNGRKNKITSSEGMLVCSDVSKNGNKLLLTMAPNGQADIYEYTVSSKRKKRVTKFSGIDVNGRYIEDESKIVFVSNRLGHANVFKKSILGSATSQIVYKGRNNNACDAYKDKIVYVSRESSNAFGHNRFNLYVTSSKNTKTRPITTTGTNQFPRFSNNAEVVLYLKQRGDKTSIGYINLETYQSLLFPFYGKKVQAIDW